MASTDHVLLRPRPDMPRGVDKGDDRHLKTFSHLHQTQCFAVTFWRWHTKVTANFFAGPFDDQMIITGRPSRRAIPPTIALSSAYARSPASSSNSSNAGERNPNIRTLWMACQLRNLPCTEIGEDFTRQFYAFSRRRCTSSSMLISSFSS